jgi:hypothetical protein
MTFSVAAVCDCRWKTAFAFIEHRYSANRSVVAAVYDCRVEENQFTKV